MCLAEPILHYITDLVSMYFRFQSSNTQNKFSKKNFKKLYSQEAMVALQWKSKILLIVILEEMGALIYLFNLNVANDL